MRWLTLSLTLLAVACAARSEETILDLSLKTREARLAGENAAWLALGRMTLARSPEHPDLLISVGRALAANGRPEDSLTHLEEAVARGAGFELAALPEFAELASKPEFELLARRARANLEPVSPQEVFLVIENTDIQPEGIAWDADTSRLFISSFSREIWSVGLDRKLARFVGKDVGLRQVAGLKVDRKRRLLWAASAVFPDFFGPSGEPDPEVGLTTAFAFDLDSGRIVRECTVDNRPAPHGFNDFALAGNGDVYVSDSQLGKIWRLPGGECRFELLIEDARMGFPNGLALSADESRLYVAHVEGLSAVDLASGRRTQLPVPAGASVNSMDGLVLDGDELIGIQPSNYLARVIRIKLASDGLAVRSVEVVSSRPPGGLSQATGTVVGSHYYSVAGPLGAPPDDGSDPRSRILRANLR